MKQLVIASNNAHKLSEIQAIVGDKFDIISLEAIGCHDDIPETAPTLEGNALQKARYIYERYHCDVFADDTGLEVAALDGRPGVHTARYAYPDRNDTEANVAKILQEMQGVTDRSAQFRTVIALIYKGVEYLFEGKVEGCITTECKGTDGFGYDPVFEPEQLGLTFAELGVEAKNTLSHRARAVQKLCEFLNNEE